MANRKKRLKKGIESLEKQIKLHEEKLKKAEEDNIELASYYRNEIIVKKKDKEEKQRILNKGG